MAAGHLDFVAFYKVFQSKFKEITNAWFDAKTECKCNKINVFSGNYVNFIFGRKWMVVRFNMDKPINVSPFRRFFQD